MADNLYDTGAPKRVIVEHRIVHDVRVSRKCGGCGRPIVDYPCPYCSGTAYPKAPPKTRVTITPQFQPVAEPKRIPGPRYKVCPKCSAMYDGTASICLSCKPDTILRPATAEEIRDFERCS